MLFDIDNLGVSEDLIAHNLVRATYRDPRGNWAPMPWLTKDAVLMLLGKSFIRVVRPRVDQLAKPWLARGN
jgi:hypothetical protein